VPTLEASMKHNMVSSLHLPPVSHHIFDSYQLQPQLHFVSYSHTFHIIVISSKQMNI
jgi:hypothetical protein